MIKNPWDDHDEIIKQFNEAMENETFVAWLKAYRDDYDTMFKKDIIGMYSAYVEGFDAGYTR